MRAKIYYNALRRTKDPITFEEVPEKYREEVKALGKKDVAAGKMPPQQYEDIFGEPYEA